MKGLIKSLLPWILYFVIAGSGHYRDEIAAFVALITTIVCNHQTLKKGFVLDWGSVIYFAALSILYLLADREILARHAVWISNGAFAAIMWFSILIRKPFTLQYAREQVPSVFWNKPGFLFVNDVISTVWALASTVTAFTPDWVMVPAYIVPALFTARFPDWYSRYKTSKSPYLNGNFKPIQTEIEVKDLTLEGQLPAHLNGVYMRNGPNPAFPPLSYTYPIDGDGMIHALYFEDGRVRYKNRFVETEGLLKERKAKKSLYGGVARGEVKDGAFIHVLHHAKKYFAMYESDPAYEISRELETMGEWCPPGATRPFPINAHTRLDPRTQQLFAITYDIKPPYLRYYILDAAGNLIQNTPIEKEDCSMVHDFVLTENYLVFFDGPALFGQYGISWKPERGMNIILVHRKTGRVTTFKTDAFFVYHFANGFERDGKIIVDYVRHEKLWLGAGEEPKQLPVLYRAIIDPLANTIREMQLDDHSCEFPRIHDRFVSEAHRFVYVPTHDNHLVQYDTEMNSAIVHDFTQYSDVGEPIVIPNGAAENDAYVGVFAYDGRAQHSEFILLSAQDFSGEALAKIKMPQRVPNGLHGVWI